MKNLFADRRLQLFLVLALVFCLYFIPAVNNGFPKGSDTYYHMRIGKAVGSSGSVVLYDALNAGGSPNAYPPLFHMALAGLYFLADPFTVSLYLGPLLSLLSVLAFYLMVREFRGDRTAILSAFIYGVSLEVINTAVFTGPANLGLLLVFLSLFLARKYEGTGRTGFLGGGMIAAVCLSFSHTISFLVFLFLFLVLFRASLRSMWPFLVSLLSFGMWLFATNGLASSVILSGPVSVFRYFWLFPAVFLAFLAPGLLKERKSMVLLFLAMFLWSLAVPMYPDRLVTYSIIPASIIASAGFLCLWDRWDRAVVRGLLVLLLVSSLGFFLYDTGFTATEMTPRDLQALAWIRGNTPQDSVIAATWQVSGVWMPAVAERANVLGALQEAVPDFEQRRQDLEVVFTSGNRELVQEKLDKYSADYIYINQKEELVLFRGVRERLGSMFKEAYSDEYVSIYEV